MLSSSVNTSSIMAAEEMKFQHRWEFRRKEDEVDSSDDMRSDSIGEPSALKKRDQVPSLVLLDNDEISNTSKLEQTSNGNHDFEAQTGEEQPKEKKSKRRRKTNQAKREVQKDCDEKIKRKKRKNDGRVSSPMDDVRSFSESLLEDLRVARENLSVWMRKEVDKLVAGTSQKKSRRNGGKKKVQVQVPNQDNLEENVQEQDMNNNAESVQVQPQNNNIADDQLMHIEKNTQVQVQKRQRKLKNTGTRAPKSNGGPSDRTNKSKKVPVESKTDCQAVDDETHCANVTGIIASTENNKVENSVALISDQDPQVQQPKSVVLAIQAQTSKDKSPEKSAKQTSKDKSPEKSAKSKKTSDSNKKPGYNQVIGSMPSTEKDIAEGIRLPSDQNFPSLSCNQVASSSMYLTLPSILSDSNNRLETSLCNYNQQRVPGNSMGIGLEKSNQMLDPSSQYGYLTSIQQPEERSGNFSQLNSRFMSCYDHNTIQPSSTSFQVPLHQNMDNSYTIPSQFRSQNLPGLRMNAGALMFSSPGYPVSDHNLVGNTLQSQPNHKADGNRLMPYRIPTIQDSYVFPK